MIKFFVMECFRNLSDDKTIYSFIEKEAILLSFSDEMVRLNFLLVLKLYGFGNEIGFGMSSTTKSWKSRT